MSEPPSITLPVRERDVVLARITRLYKKYIAEPKLAQTNHDVLWELACRNAATDYNATDLPDHAAQALRYF